MAKKFETVSDYWIQDKKQYVKLSTICAYKAILKTHVLPYFGKMNGISEKSVQDFVFILLKANLSTKTVKDALVVVKMICRFATKKKLMNVEMMDIVFPTVEKKDRICILSKRDERKLADYLQQNFSFRNLGILICLVTGMRIGEICALCWSDIDSNNGEVVVNKTIQRVYLNEPNEKTRLLIDVPKTVCSQRRIPLCSSLLTTIKPLLHCTTPSFYVISNDLKPIEPRVYRKYFESVVEKLGIPKIKFHGLRHTFATRCIESNGDYKTVSSILGHSSITTTLNLYVHPNKDQKRKCIEKMLRSV